MGWDYCKGMKSSCLTPNPWGKPFWLGGPSMVEVPKKTISFKDPSLEHVETY
jgi:hypothetical protein